MVHGDVLICQKVLYSAPWYRYYKIHMIIYHRDKTIYKWSNRGLFLILQLSVGHKGLPTHQPVPDIFKNKFKPCHINYVWNAYAPPLKDIFYDMIERKFIYIVCSFIPGIYSPFLNQTWTVSSQFYYILGEDLKNTWCECLIKDTFSSKKTITTL